MFWSEFSRMDAREISVALAFALLPAAAMLWQARRNARGDLLGDWSSSHFVVVSAENRQPVTDHLRRLVWARGLGAAVGWVLGWSITNPAGPWGGVIIGYLASTAIAEVTAHRTLGTGVASLAPRRLEAYIPSPAIAGARALAAVSIVIGAIPFFVRAHPRSEGLKWTVMGLAVGVAAFGVFGEALVRRVVARRQTAGSAELLAVDDALRSTSAHLLMASVLAAELIGLGSIAIGAASAVSPAALRWGGFIVGLVSMIAAIFTLHLLAPRPWRVRRSTASATA